MNTTTHTKPGTIAADMPLNDLIDRMAPNCEQFRTLHQANAMRAQLVDDAPAYGWKTCADVEDADWFRMLDNAMKATA